MLENCSKDAQGSKEDNYWLKARFTVFYKKSNFNPILIKRQGYSLVVFSYFGSKYDFRICLKIALKMPGGPKKTITDSKHVLQCFTKKWNFNPILIKRQGYSLVVNSYFGYKYDFSYLLENCSKDAQGSIEDHYWLVESFKVF